jgi:hypothetical protein
MNDYEIQEWLTLDEQALFGSTEANKSMRSLARTRMALVEAFVRSDGALVKSSYNFEEAINTMPTQLPSHVRRGTLTVVVGSPGSGAEDFCLRLAADNPEVRILFSGFSWDEALMMAKRGGEAILVLDHGNRPHYQNGTVMPRASSVAAEHAADTIYQIAKITDKRVAVKVAKSRYPKRAPFIYEVFTARECWSVFNRAVTANRGLAADALLARLRKEVPSKDKNCPCVVCTPPVNENKSLPVDQAVELLQKLNEAGVPVPQAEVRAVLGIDGE